jgi:DNA-binding response OmpR family regulator
MQSTILVYGNEPVLVTTRGLILERAGYEVFTAETLANAVLAMMNHPIDLCILCQSLTGEERRRILGTARALQPEIKCVVMDFEESEAPVEGTDHIRGLVGPSTLLEAIANMLTQKASFQASAS